MGRYSLKVADPARYAEVVHEQADLKGSYASRMTMARLCPYCDHKIEVLYRGNHGSSSIKCPNCGEEVFFPPVSFRMSGQSQSYFGAFFKS